MTIDWARLLDSRGIEWVDQGSNVASGHINIQCPWCGEADQSHHFGIRLTDGAWGCFRDSTHRGRSQVKLLTAILGCTYAEANTYLESNTFPEDVDLDTLLDQLNESDAEARPGPIEQSAYFHEFQHPHAAVNYMDVAPQRAFTRYLRLRGYPQPIAFAKRYGLTFALNGNFENRLIIPFHLNGELVGWTGRDITGKATIRYKTHPPGRVTRFLLGNLESASRGGRTLYITEGPLDALRLSWFGRDIAQDAVALLGLSLQPPKIALLATLVPRYRRIILLLDKGAAGQQITMLASLGVLGVEHGELPKGVDDPGDLTQWEALELMEHYQ